MAKEAAAIGVVCCATLLWILGITTGSFAVNKFYSFDAYKATGVE